MADSTNIPRFRFWLWLIRVIGVIVPRRLRADWRQEWEAELQHREALLAQWDRLGWRNKLNLLWRSTSAFWDALWLQPKRLEDDMFQDLRFGVRMLLKHKGFTTVAILTLALGIGANTAIFSLLDALLLKPLPGVAEAERLVQIGRTNSGAGFNPFSYADYRDFCAQNTTLIGMAAETQQAFHLGTDKIAERIQGALVSGNYFETLGVKAAQGRLLLPADAETEGAFPVAVISERLWRKYFTAADSVAGQTISLNSHTYTIVGVASAFRGTRTLGEKTDIWIPVTMWGHGDPWMVKNGTDWLTSRSSRFVELVGRLKPGVTVAQAQADLTTITERLAQDYPQTNRRSGVTVVPGLGLGLNSRKEATRFAGLQMGIVAVVLLIACANVASLLLARASARRKEIGIRLALGAGRWRIARQLLTESVMLALLSGILGVGGALWLNEWMRAALPERLNSLALKIEFALDMRALVFTLGVSLVTGILFGLAPALQLSKPDLISALKDGRGSSGRGRGARMRNALVVGQIALSLLLLISAALCLRTLRNAQAINLGFDYKNLLTAKLDLDRQNYSEERGRIFYQQLLERVSSLPDVQSTSLAVTGPLQGSGYGNTVALDTQQQLDIHYNIVTPHYLDMMGIPLLFGRSFTEQNNAQSPFVAIVNETFARRAWPNENPIGKYFKLRGSKKETPVEVIGVARDVKGANLLENTPYGAYLPLAQRYDGGMTLHLRTSSKPEQLVASVQREISALDQKLPIYNVKTLEQYLSAALSSQRLQAQLIGVFGLLALLLASIGLYGVLSYSVAQRTQEIGIRMALGAQSGDVMRVVVGQGSKLITLGVALGVAGAFAATRVLKRVLYGVSATDPPTFIGVSLLLLIVAFMACWIPARRATQVDPMIALRHD